MNRYPFQYMQSSPSNRLNLIFDADDTLWDSNIHFLEAFDSFVDAILGAGCVVERKAIHNAVRQAELKLIETHGYGRRPYIIALHQAVRAIAPVQAEQPIHDEIDRIGELLIERHCELLPDVEPTVHELATRHQLILFTKGQRDEQLLKLERSGLAPLFSRVETPREKDVHAYRRLIDEAELDPAASYMIGNSPRSDINPAVRAGLRAVYIPHPHTWDLEHEEIDSGDERIIELPSFRRLAELF
ncbi:MAG TPA: HAD family hydrolase [Candidatus Binataceae bacterium]